jgi:hypothetical protein
VGFYYESLVAAMLAKHAVVGLKVGERHIGIYTMKMIAPLGLQFPFQLGRSGEALAEDGVPRLRGSGGLLYLDRHRAGVLAAMVVEVLTPIRPVASAAGATP